MARLNAKSGKAMLSFRYTLLQYCSYNDVPTSVFVVTTTDLTKCARVLPERIVQVLLQGIVHPMGFHPVVAFT